jgi:hypothetical protein
MLGLFILLLIALMLYAMWKFPLFRGMEEKA